MILLISFGRVQPEMLLTTVGRSRAQGNLDRRALTLVAKFLLADDPLGIRVCHLLPRHTSSSINRLP